jgi:uncharacterized protein
VKLFGRREQRAYRVFFATDVHGSDRCFRKFLAAPKAYQADALVLGGDVAGKAIVPIAPSGSGRFTYVRHGVTEAVERDELDRTAAMINVGGDYPLVCEPDEQTRLRDDIAYRESVFEKIITEQLRDWCELARERLDDGVRCIITPGNDDPRCIDGVLASQAPRVECPELAVVQLGPIWLASLGNTNRTPWDTEREYDEDELAAQIDTMVSPCADGRPLVFNFHCPPHDSGLDTAAQLDADLRPVVQHGAIATGPVGSTAVRDAIERYKPVVGLHGHIHESRGACKIGASVCLNPGSDYGAGVLKGALVDFTDDGQYCEHLFTAG